MVVEEEEERRVIRTRHRVFYSTKSELTFSRLRYESCTNNSNSNSNISNNTSRRRRTTWPRDGAHKPSKIIKSWAS